ncbi:type II secretion system F family protein [Candidatus Roizmanbacteria bacterium]|nr:type II secretion system F family protein [Candidatus Roizmanbacteria bacterium]
MFFTYKALKDSQIVTGKIETNSEKDAVQLLKGKHLFPIEIKKAQRAMSFSIGSYFNHVNFNDIVDLTRQLAIMLNAGLTLIDCLDILKKQIVKPALYKLVDDIDKSIRSGKSLSESLSEYHQYFSNLYIALIKSGEASGKMSDILLKLSDNLEKQRAFQGKIKGALIYPVIVIAGMFVVMFVMVTFVVPKLLDLYKDFNIDLPLPTKILIFVSNFSLTFWPIYIPSLFVGMGFLKRYFATKTGKRVLDKFLLRTPVIKNVIKMSVLVDSTRTLSILIGSGVSILEAMAIIIETTNNVIFQDAFISINKQVEKGVSLGQAMTNEGVFPPILVQMTTVGEQTGHLDDTLMRIAVYFEMESELAVKTLTTLIEPLILVVLGVGVGFLVMAVITPIYNLTNSFN